jgi:hypothetical protein
MTKEELALASEAKRLRQAETTPVPNGHPMTKEELALASEAKRLRQAETRLVDELCPAGYTYSHNGFWDNYKLMASPYGLVMAPKDYPDGVDVEECAARCNSVPGCVAFSGPRRLCWLYDSIGDEVENHHGHPNIACTKGEAAPTTTTTSTEAATTCWYVGERVMIVPGSRYGYQSAACGTITSDTCDGGGYQWITFDDGYSNCYEFADYEECSLAEVAKTCWHVGERVMIVPGSRYGYQSAACGTITYDTCDGGGYQWITFDDGYSNCYEFADYTSCE